MQIAPGTVIDRIGPRDPKSSSRTVLKMPEFSQAQDPKPKSLAPGLQGLSTSFEGCCLSRGCRDDRVGLCAFGCARRLVAASFGLRHRALTQLLAGV